VLEHHVVGRGKTNTGTEDVLHSSALLSQSVDHRGTGANERSLEHVAEDRKNAVERRVLGHITSFVLDTGHELSDSDKINDERSGKQRVFANVVDGDTLATTHKDVALVLIQSAHRERT